MTRKVKRPESTPASRYKKMISEKYRRRRGSAIGKVGDLDTICHAKVYLLIQDDKHTYELKSILRKGDPPWPPNEHELEGDNNIIRLKPKTCRKARSSKRKRHSSTPLSSAESEEEASPQVVRPRFKLSSEYYLLRSKYFSLQSDEPPTRRIGGLPPPPASAREGRKID